VGAVVAIGLEGGMDDSDAGGVVVVAAADGDVAD
jgi:hypothetical protein